MCELYNHPAPALRVTALWLQYQLAFSIVLPWADLRLWARARWAADHTRHVHGVRGDAMVQGTRDYAQFPRLQQEQYVVSSTG